MRRSSRQMRVLPTFLVLAALFGPSTAGAQVHDHANMKMDEGPGWQLMQDAIVFAEFNHQSGPRGGDEFVVPNWWMGMASRKMPRGQLTFTAMLSLDPATVGKSGYRELFQAGEALDGRPLIDRQHPHDFFMQLAAVWRLPLTAGTGLTLAGGPVGEPALGPVAFMHRASAADNPTAPLGHHTFDSTHIAFGVVTAGVDHGPWIAEGSIFNGREPDEDRWNIEAGRLDSFSGRLWYRPTPRWEMQISKGHLKKPEALEPGNINRTTGSVSWTKQAGANFSAVSAAFGRNDTSHGSRNAFFLEGTRHVGLNTIYSRFEAVQTETAILLADRAVDGPAAQAKDPVFALTIGAVRDVLRLSGYEGGFGADVTWYGAPDSLQGAYGKHPFGLRLFFRLRPPAGAMGRMLNMWMSEPMQGSSGAAMDHPMAASEARKIGG
jgi:hypothetical protein